MEKKHSVFQRIRTLVADDKRDEALTLLDNISLDCNDNDFKKHVKILQSRNISIKREEISGTKTEDYLAREKRQVSSSILDLLESNLSLDNFSEKVSLLDNKEHFKFSMGNIIKIIFTSSIILNILFFGVILFEKLRSPSKNSIDKHGMIRIDSIGSDYVRIGMGNFILNAKKEFIYFGPSFHTSAENFKGEIKKQLDQKIKFKILLFDFSDKPAAKEMIFQAGDDETRFIDYMKKGLNDLLAIRGDLSRDAKSNFEIRMTKYIPRQRFYIYDPNDKNGQTYLIPHLNRITAIKCPGFLLNNEPSGIFGCYYQSFENSWHEATPIDSWLKTNSNLIFN